jgi:hypothetical protein
MKRIATIALLVASMNSLRAANNLNNHGGPTMQNQVKAFFIYWMPSGVVLDTSVTDGIGNFETLSKRFFDDLSATSFYNIVTQYPGQCGSNQMRSAEWAGGGEVWRLMDGYASLSACRD